jgi:hypothetical protein
LGDFSALHLLWLQTKTLKENQWDIPFLPRPWFAFRTELETNTKTHPIPDFTLDLSSTIIPPLEPEYHFSMFLTHEKQVPSLPLGPRCPHFPFPYLVFKLLVVPQQLL